MSFYRTWRENKEIKTEYTQAAVSPRKWVVFNENMLI